MGDLALIPGLGRSSREGNGNPLWYSCLEKSMNRGALQATVHGFTKMQTWLSNLLWQQQLLTKHLTLFKFSCFLHIFYCSRIPPRILRYILLSGLIRLLLAVAASNTFLVFDDLESLRSSGHALCRTSLYWILSDVFLMIRLGLWVLVRKIAKA